MGPKIVKEHPNFFGKYTYKAMYEGHPSYELLGVKPMYLFYDKKTNKWTFGPTLGNKSGSEYGSEVLTSKSSAVLPGPLPGPRPPPPRPSPGLPGLSPPRRPTLCTGPSHRQEVSRGGGS